VGARNLQRPKVGVTVERENLIEGVLEKYDTQVN
jgi:hypothetical protein